MVRPTILFLGIAFLWGCSDSPGGGPDGGNDGAGFDGGTGTDGGLDAESGVGKDGGASGICVNGVVDPGEACDGANLVHATCASLGFTGGTLACSASCQFDVSSCTGGTITPSITPSRTSCAAPCSVFFDATATTGLSGNDYVQANWTWDFGDPTSPHKSTIGFVVAHVFDNPGTYDVTTRVQDLAGNAGTKTTTITVAPMSGPIYYVASTGSDTDTGKSTTHPFLTFAHAMTVAGPNTSILLRRGDTFKLGSSDTTIAVTGPFLIGAYSDPSAPSSVNPILSSTDIVAYSNVFKLTGGSDMRFTDIHIVAEGAFSIFTIGSAPMSLFERVEIEGYTQGGGNGWYVGTDLANITIADSHAHDFGGYGVYADRSQNFALIGTTIEKFQVDHAFRLQGGSSNGSGTLGQFTNNSYIADNTITAPVGNTFSAGGLFRGENTNSVYVNNTNNRNVAWTPQDITFIEHVSLGLAEGNTWARTDYDPNMACLGIVAQNIVVRNNLCTRAAVFAKVGAGTNMPANWTDRNFFYNNTFYQSDADSFAVQLVQVTKTTGTTSYRNNIVSTVSSNGQSSIYQSDNVAGQTNISDHNDLYAPNGGTLTNPLVGTGGILTNPNFVSTTAGAEGAFTLGSGSPAVDTGTNTHVYQSLGNAPGRPQNGSWDMGAFEVKSP